LILAREIFVEQINHAVAADFGFVLHIKPIALGACAAFHKLANYDDFDPGLSQ
jgi:hypothetical protein